MWGNILSHIGVHHTINLYLYLYIYACIKSLITYVSDIDSYHVGFLLLYWGPVYVQS